MGRCLALNVNYEPIGFLPQERAVCTYLEGKADIIESGDNEFRSPSGLSVPAPLVIRLNRYIKIPHSLREGISSRVLFARDDWTCQYCGKHQSKLGKKNSLTVDHIKPKAHGGPHHWENVVTSCYVCNLKKRDRTPTQANMKFVAKYKNKAPVKPHLSWGGRVTVEQEKWICMFYKVDSLSDKIKVN